MIQRALAVFIGLAVFSLMGCSSHSMLSRTPGDPLEKMNRRVYAFNTAFDRKLRKPVSKAYRKVTPNVVKVGISNFVSNLGYPAVIMNDALQGKPMPALRDTGRFVLNTTVGVVGFFDPATAVGLDANNEDFGQTLGRWGIGAGPYLVLPFMNPTTLRDGLARVADPFTNPLTQTGSNVANESIAALRLLNTGPGKPTSGVESALGEPFDPYAVARSIYVQRRDYLVYDGDVPLDPLEIEILEQQAAKARIELSSIHPPGLPPANATEE